MKSILNEIISFGLTMIIYHLGGLDIALQSLLVVMFLDFISGISCAIYNKKINSKRGFKGLLKKVGYLIIIALVVVIDKITLNDGTIRTFIIYYFVANDGISIVENLAKMKVKLPKKLIDTLEQLKGDNEDD